MEHIARDGRAALTNYAKEIINKTLPANHAPPLSAQIILNVVKSGVVRSGSNVSVILYNAETKSIQKI